MFTCCRSPKASSFDSFAENPEVKKLVEDYRLKRTITTQAGLLLRLEKIDVKVSLRTLITYLAIWEERMKSIEEPYQDKSDGDLELIKCFSEKDNKKLYLIGKNPRFNKFHVTNEAGESEYLTCNECDKLQRLAPRQ